MATTKPRVAVTLDEHTHAVIARLAELQGRTRGSVIAELLDEVAPVLGRTVALLEAAAAAPEQVKAGLRSVVEGVHRDLVKVAGDSVGQLDMLLAVAGKQVDGETGLQGDGETGLQGSEGSAEGGANPHVVTRGSGQGGRGAGRAAKGRKKPNGSRG